MLNLSVGDEIFFPTMTRLVNEGTVEAIEGPYIKVKSKCPGTEYIMATSAFKTMAELINSAAYQRAWAQQNERRRYNEAFGRISSMSVF